MVLHGHMTQRGGGVYVHLNHTIWIIYLAQQCDYALMTPGEKRMFKHFCSSRPALNFLFPFKSVIFSQKQILRTSHANSLQQPLNDACRFLSQRKCPLPFLVNSSSLFNHQILCKTYCGLAQGDNQMGAQSPSVLVKHYGQTPRSEKSHVRLCLQSFKLTPMICLNQTEREFVPHFCFSDTIWHLCDTCLSSTQSISLILVEDSS